jgi:2-oxo-3-hexenedioate decarboxylase
MVLQDGGAIDAKDHIHPRIEPEIAFLLGKPLRGAVTSVQAWDAVDGVCCALEIIDSRYANFKFTLEDVVADNGSSSRFVVGSTVRKNDIDVANLGMVMEKNGAVAEVGSSAAIYDHPLKSLVALVHQLAAVNDGLPAGSLVMTGGATAAIALSPGDRVVLSVQHLGTASCNVLPA